MRHRPRRGAERPLRSRNWVAGALTLVSLVPAVVGCAPTVMEGRAASMLYDPDRVGGLHATDGLSGVRRDAPGPQGDVEGTDGSDDDRLALLAVNDIQDFWAATYPAFFSGQYTPVSALISYDSTNPFSRGVCGRRTSYDLVNASYCSLDDSVSWDCASFIPNTHKYFGDIAVVGVLAHELGHAIQTKAHLVHRRSDTIIKEQQADCFASDKPKSR
jgi:predicted metalloprotease